jgi:diguanylate cyclase (GGDEF)-like protein/PAS domain S-box-containing protein
MDQQNFYKDVLDNLYDGVYFADRARRITYWNKGAERISGFTSAEVLGKCCADNILNHVNDNGIVLCKTMCPLSYTMRDGRPRQDNIYLHHKDGHRVPVLVNAIPLYGENHQIVGAIESFTDTSAFQTVIERVKLLSEIAFQDELTSIGNRRFIEMKLKTGVTEVQEFGANIGLLLFDVDHFKAFNDNYGHDLGDQVLKMVANTINHNIRPMDFLGRWGGEEFIVLLQNVDEAKAISSAQKLRMLIENSFLRIDQKNVSITVSGGGTLIRPEDTTDSLFKRVDQLLYESKHKGRNQLTFSL